MTAMAMAMRWAMPPLNRLPAEAEDVVGDGARARFSEGTDGGTALDLEAERADGRASALATGSQWADLRLQSSSRAIALEQVAHLVPGQVEADDEEGKGDAGADGHPPSAM